MTYNITLLQNANTTYDLISYANTSVEGIFVGLTVIAIFFIMLLVMKKWEFSKGLLVSSFISFINASVLVYIGLLNFVYALGFLVLFAFTALYVWTVE